MSLLKRGTVSSGEEEEEEGGKGGTSGCKRAKDRERDKKRKREGMAKTNR